MIDNQESPHVPERHNIFDNPFRPFAQQSAPDNRVSNLERRAEQAETALHAARRDLAAERERNGLAAEVDSEAARRKERKRVHAIMSAPVALRMPEVAYTFALKTHTPAAEAIAIMEASAKESPEVATKALAEQIILSGKMRRGEVPAPVTGAGPKVFVKATAESILAAAKKRDEK
jgi:hypothetical protein